MDTHHRIDDDAELAERRRIERDRVARRVERARGSAPRLAYSPDEAAVALGVSRRTICDLIARGELASAKLGARRVIPRSAIEALLG